MLTTSLVVLKHDKKRAPPVVAECPIGKEWDTPNRL